ncbi:MAG: T9SS type A sorting domain-containing protein [Bacteroidota bacterium]
MKKITFLSVAVAVASQLNGQFIQLVNHVGALSSDASQDWTKGWAEWNPKQASYGIATETTTLNDASGIKNITGTVTLDASKVYLLTSTCVVRSGGKLIIPAGTVIRGAADLTATPKLYATLVVERGGMIEVNGTTSSPVVMTSNKAAGSRDRGDWGGLVLCGKAVNNQSVDAQLEGFNNVAVDNTLGKFGGTDDADNSGVVKYVRIEFAGLAFEPNKEVNSFTMGSVGSKTEIEGVQCSFGNDDGFEWFGGTVNCKKLISYKITDDDFDTDFGYRGAVQFGIAVRDTAYFDLSWNAPSGASTSETFESDNDAAGSGKMPLTSAVFSNITCVGPVPLDKTYNDLITTQKGAFRRGARIRRNSRLSIVNSVFMGYRNFIMFDGDSVLIASGVKSSTFSETSNVLRNNFIANTSAAAAAGVTNTGLVEVDSKNTPAAMDAWLRDAKNSNKIDDVNYASGAILVDPKNATAPDFRPVAASKINTLANYDAAIFTKYGKFSSVNTVGNVVVTNAYPVPATDNVNVELYAVASENVAVSISDISGKVVKSLGNQSLVAGGNMITASVSDLNNGLYFLNVVSNGSKTTYRFTVAK